MFNFKYNLYSDEWLYQNILNANYWINMSKSSYSYQVFIPYPEMALLGFSNVLVDLCVQWQNLIDKKGNSLLHTKS